MESSISSKNDLGAENRQERLEIAWWIVGFVDGEGTFSISIFKNHTTKSGWQVFPEFVITQGERSVSALKLVKEYFEIGNLFINRRHDNHRENLYRYCVRSVKELDSTIIPFFDKYSLKSDKLSDYKKFKKCILLIKQKKHLTNSGLRTIRQIAKTMNKGKSKKFLESSEAIRQIPLSN